MKGRSNFDEGIDQVRNQFQQIVTQLMATFQSGPPQSEEEKSHYEVVLKANVGLLSSRLLWLHQLTKERPHRGITLESATSTNRKAKVGAEYHLKRAEQVKGKSTSPLQRSIVKKRPSDAAGKKPRLLTQTKTQSKRRA